MNDIRNVKVSLTLPEDLVDAYEKRGQAVNLTAPTMMQRTLKMLQKVDVNDRLLFLSTDGRRMLESLAETTIENENDLIKLVKSLTRVSLHDIHIYLTERQLGKFEDFANFEGVEVSEYLEQKLTDAVLQAIGEW